LHVCEQINLDWIGLEAENQHFRPAGGFIELRFTWNLARHDGPLGRSKFHDNRCTGVGMRPQI